MQRRRKQMIVFATVALIAIAVFAYLAFIVAPSVREVQINLVREAIRRERAATTAQP